MQMSCDPMQAIEKERKTTTRRVNLAKFAAHRDKATAFSCSLVLRVWSDAHSRKLL